MEIFLNAVAALPIVNFLVCSGNMFNEANLAIQDKIEDSQKGDQGSILVNSLPL